MNKMERAILNRVKEIAQEYFLEEIAKIQKEISDEKAEKIYLDVLNTGILLDVNKVKKHGLNSLTRYIEKGSKAAKKNRQNTDDTAAAERRRSGDRAEI